jgi:hypothetical protein
MTRRARLDGKLVPHPPGSLRRIWYELMPYHGKHVTVGESFVPSDGSVAERLYEARWGSSRAPHMVALPAGCLLELKDWIERARKPP